MNRIEQRVDGFNIMNNFPYKAEYDQQSKMLRMYKAFYRAEYDPDLDLKKIRPEIQVVKAVRVNEDEVDVVDTLKFFNIKN